MNKLDYFIDEFTQYLIIEKNLSNNSVNSYNRDIIHYVDYLEREFEITDVKDIKREHIINYLSSLYDQNMKPRTIARRIAAIRNFHKFLFLNEYVNVNVSSFVELPKLDKELPEVLSVQEVNEIIDSVEVNDPISLRNKTIFELLYSTGLRVSELVNLNIDDVHLAMGVIRCRGKGNKERILPVGEVAHSLLDQYLNQARKALNKHYDNQTLFLSIHGKRLDRQRVWQIVKNYASMIGLKVTPHTFRHSYATHMLENQADIRYIQEMLGHSSLSTTQIYTHINSKTLTDVINKFHPRSKMKHNKNQEGE
ncbi:MAG: site-specific tyrosine recombinase XerD [Bacilli bacterium]|nr:site-specific tyrosine recombinase XerD [Bacilli bacterium]